MKKTVLFLFLSLVMIGCKKNNDQKVNKEDDPCVKIIDKAAESLSPDCIRNETLKQFLCLKEEEQADWLKINGHKICDELLYECIVPFHVIDSVKFDEIARRHTGNTSRIVLVEKTWKEIDDVIKSVKCYDQYLSFDLAGNDIKLKLVNQFTTKETCYSIPFLRGIQLTYNLKPDSKLYFTRALIPVYKSSNTVDEERVIFKFTDDLGSGLGFYDLSNFPGLLPYSVPCRL